MQTDPNWGNFLYDESKRSINLIDFGAARDYPKRFVDDYLRMVNILCFTHQVLWIASCIFFLVYFIPSMPNKISLGLSQIFII